MGHDMSDEEHVLEAGLGFAVKTDKRQSRFGDFIGRDSVLRVKQQGLKKRMLQFKLEDPEPLLYHHEPIFRDGKLAGYVTSANYGHFLGGAIGMGYVKCDPAMSNAELLASKFDIEVGDKRYTATASFKPMHDPEGKRIKA